MKITINNMNLKLIISKPFLAFVGFLLLCYYIWFRFIRERVPKEIPFDLTLISLLILLYICVIYFYLIIKLLETKKATVFNLQLLILLQKLAVPFLILDEYLRNQKYTKLILDLVLKKSLNLIKNILINLKTISILETINNSIIIIINVSTIIFLFLFLLDLYNNKLDLIYNYIIIQIIPLVITYYIYLLKLYVQNKIRELSIYYMVEVTSKDTDNTCFFTSIASMSFDEDFTSFDGGDVDEPYPLLNIEKFITLQAYNIQFGIYDLYAYQCYIKQEFTKNKDIILSKDFTFWIPVLIYNYIWIDIYDSSIYSKVRRRISLIIYLIYFFIWMYILVVSLHTFHFSELETRILQEWQDNVEPFSDLPNEVD